MLLEMFTISRYVNIYDLGLIYEINYNLEKAHAEIVMTLTSPFCPFPEELLMWTHEATVVFRYTHL